MSPLPSRTAHQRQRVKQQYENNSLRRTYNLLHFSLPWLEPCTSLVEEALVVRCSASRNTVRTVLRRLADEGLVSRRTKVGTTSARWMVLPADEVMKLDELGSASGGAMRGEVLEALVIRAPKIVQERLELPDDALVLVIDGLLYVDADLPVALTVSYVAIDDPQQASPLPQDVDPIAFLEDVLGITLGSSTSTLGAMTAAPVTAQTLGVPEGAALVWMEEVLTDAGGRPRALSQHRFRGDRVAFSVGVGRAAAAPAFTRLPEAGPRVN